LKIQKFVLTLVETFQKPKMTLKDKRKVLLSLKENLDSRELKRGKTEIKLLEKILGD
jgi:hypothetical protein